MGVVPCAGSSSRMGYSKALLDGDGEPFLRRVVRALSDGGCDPVVVVVRDPEGSEGGVARSAGARVVSNPDPDPGPISSLRIALRLVSRATEGIVVLPVDHPRVQSSTVAALLGMARKCPGRIVVATHHGRRGHPAVFPPELMEELRDPHLEGGARTVVRSDPRRVVEVEVADPGVLLDIDDPADYEAAFGGPPRVCPP